MRHGRRAALLLLSCAVLALASNAFIVRTAFSPGRSDWRDVRDFFVADLSRLLENNPPSATQASFPRVHISVGKEAYARMAGGVAEGVALASRGVVATDSRQTFTARLRLASNMLPPPPPHLFTFTVRTAPQATFPYEEVSFVKPSSRHYGMEVYLRGRLATAFGALSAIGEPIEVTFNGKIFGTHIAIARPDEFFLRRSRRLPGDVNVRKFGAVTLDEAAAWVKTATHNQTAASDLAAWHARRAVWQSHGARREEMNMPAFAAYLATCLLLPARRDGAAAPSPAWFLDPSSNRMEPILFNELASLPDSPDAPLYDGVAPMILSVLENKVIEREALRAALEIIESDSLAALVERTCADLDSRLSIAASRDLRAMTWNGRQWVFLGSGEITAAADRLQAWVSARRVYLRETIRSRLSGLPPPDERAETIVWEGMLRFRQTVVYPETTTILIRPGAVLLFESGVSILAHGVVRAEGTAERPIRLRPARDGEAWGVLALQGRAGGRHFFRHVIFEGGSHAVVQGTYYSGTLSVYNADAVMEYCLFRDNRYSDDLFNAKHATVEMRDCSFQNAFMDAIDLDICDGLLERVEVLKAGNDGLDLMTSAPVIRDCRMVDCDDKGISVGENSAPVIERCEFHRTTIGIASKDDSFPIVRHSRFVDCPTGVALYRKNTRYFGAGGGRFVGNVFSGCRNVLLVEEDVSYQWERNRVAPPGVFRAVATGYPDVS
jgi:hypothetical protein